MRILFLTKRRYMRQDVMTSRYGRFWHLPFELSQLGHDVFCECAAYYPEQEPRTIRLRGGSPERTLAWQSHRLFPYSPLAWLRYEKLLEQTARSRNIECVIAASDAFHIILGARLAEKLKVPLVADFYDNFESYFATRIPGVKSLLRNSSRKAKVAICISANLKEKLVCEYGLHADRVLMAENGVEPHFFSSLPQAKAREHLRLPVKGRLIGTAGALSSDRGIAGFLQGFLDAAERDEALHLVLAGDLAGQKLPMHPRIHFLGTLAHADIVSFWRALDLGVVCARDDEFGRYCFPQKAAEIAAAGTPMAFSGVGVMATDIADTWGERVLTGRADEWARAIRKQLDDPARPGWRPRTWQQLATQISEVLQREL